MAVAMAAGAAASASAWDRFAHLLKNRFYIGEVVYRGEVHRGEHEPILARDLFEAVQARRAANVVARQLRLRGSAAPLTGRLFDDRGNRISPTHANKRGVRYRYYVSHAILQNQRAEAGSVARIPAPEIETLVCDGVRRHLAAMGGTEVATTLAECELTQISAVFAEFHWPAQPAMIGYTL